MNALQKRLAQIETESQENGLCDGIVYEDAEDQCYWIYNHYSYCEWLSTIWCITPNLAGKKLLRN